MSSQEQTLDQVKSTWMQQAGQCLPTLQVSAGLRHPK